MAWRPLNQNNSIERVRVAVRFTEQIPAKLAREMSSDVARKQHDLRFEGPEPRTNIGISLIQNGLDVIPQTKQSQAGWQFARKASNGIPIEAFVYENNTIVYETAEYVRWEMFSRRLEKVSKSSFDLCSKVLDIEAISLEYLDRFTFTGSASDADVSDLLGDAAQQVHPFSRSGKGLWHTHKGWFEDLDHGQVLINQNFDMQDGNLQGRSEPVRSIQILTLAEFRKEKYDITVETFDRSLDSLHSLTDRYFRSAIQIHYHATVGMN